MDISKNVGKAVKYGVAFMVLWAILGFAVMGVVGYTFIHFITKWW